MLLIFLMHSSSGLELDPHMLWEGTARQGNVYILCVCYVQFYMVVSPIIVYCHKGKPHLLDLQVDDTMHKFYNSKLTYKKWKMAWI